MVAKKVVIGMSCAILLSAAIACLMLNEKISELKKSELVEKNNIKQATQPQIAPAKQEKIKYDLYSTTPYDLPLYSISEIAKLPANVKKYIDNVLETAQGFYWLKYDKEEGRVFIILQNPISETNVYSRHNLEILEIFINKDDGSFLKTVYSPVYAGEDGETINSVEGVFSEKDVWEFDKSIEPQRPVKHTVYDDRGKTKFIEYWSYSDTESVKYKMKDASKKIVSLLKETFENETDYRREHILYDKEGQTTMSLTISYSGANISRISYYDQHNPKESFTIINEYQDNLKTSEKIYSSDYELLYTTKSTYQDQERKQIYIENHLGEKIVELNS